MSTPNTAMEIPAKLVKELRDRTNAGLNDCRAALVEAAGDIEKAIAVLRKKGQAAAAKKATREASEGLVGSYIHAGGKIGVLVEVNCESDFVARTEDFGNLVKEVAMHIAAADPKWVRREDVPAEAIEKEKAIYRAQMEGSGKPAQVLDKIVEGKLEKFFSEQCLLEQPFIKDATGKMRVKELVDQVNAATKEKVVVKRFARFQVGGGG